MLEKSHLPKLNNSILLEGSSGAGKSYLAKWIHNESKRKDKPFYHLNISSLAENIFESELFGHSKGSFTGALSDKKGFCEIVGEGTLFLDEIGELNLDQQKKLLTLLEEKIFYSIGSSHVKKFKGVLLFATNKDLQLEVKNGNFREDLYFRIRAFTYKVENLNDIPEKRKIIEKEFEKAMIENNKTNLEMGNCVREFLGNYHFPGNYRELKQIAAYSVFLAEKTITIKELPIWINEKNVKSLSTDNYYDALNEFELNFLKSKLKKFQGRINYTSEQINLSKVTLISKIKKYGIDINQIKINQYA